MPADLRLSEEKASLLRDLRRVPSSCRGTDEGMPEGLRKTVVDVPYSLIAGEFRDLTVVYVAKVIQLARNQQGECVAELTTMARWLGLKNRIGVDARTGELVEKAPSALYAAQKEAREAELVSVRRRTLRGGRGTSAARVFSGFERGDFRVPVPVALLGAVSARHVRAYMLVAYAHYRRIPFSLADLASGIRHESGRRKGESISGFAASRLVDDLERWGWLEVQRRAGHQGRHLVVPRRTPLVEVAEPVDNMVPASGAGVEAEASADLGCEPLADLPRVSEDQDPDLQMPRDVQLDAQSLVEEVGSDAVVDNSPLAGAGVLALRADGASKSSSRKVQERYSGPELTVSPQIAFVLEPVRSLLATGRVSVYVQRQVAREIGSQFKLAISPERIRQRLQSRYAGVGFNPRNPNGWLLSAVQRWGCEKAECEHGEIWETGERCERCFFLREESRRAKLKEWRDAHPEEAEAGDLHWAERRKEVAREKADRARQADSVENRLAIREAIPGDAECIGKDGFCGKPVRRLGDTLCPACAGLTKCSVIGCWTWHRGPVCPDPRGLPWKHLPQQDQHVSQEWFGYAAPLFFGGASDSELLISGGR
ncbi:hypothetical protein [Kitasatospora sp. NPDC088779]|uniref:hypothetical protein n=1 Tax=Kitasatospora sp. NPDC088779 TaxID=3154964 RepID=UPI00342C4DE3